MRQIPFTVGSYYHIYNRGVDKRDVYNDVKDLERFKESVKQFNQIEGIGSLNWYRNSLKVRGLSSNSVPLVAIVAISINPNHFHFILKQLVDGGIAKFMQKLLGGYTYYFNQKHARSGSLFQGTFKSKLIEDDNYFRKIFAYVNQNYAVHNIPKSKSAFIFASDKEYESEHFDFVSKIEGREMLKTFGGKNNLKKHCQEIISIIRKERGKASLEELDELLEN